MAAGPVAPAGGGHWGSRWEQCLLLIARRAIWCTQRLRRRAFVVDQLGRRAGKRRRRLHERCTMRAGRGRGCNGPQSFQLRVEVVQWPRRRLGDLVVVQEEPPFGGACGVSVFVAGPTLAFCVRSLHKVRSPTLRADPLWALHLEAFEALAVAFPSVGHIALSELAIFSTSTHDTKRLVCSSHGKQGNELWKLLQSCLGCLN
eukprot:1748872-Amphidinium_carterae.1